MLNPRGDGGHAGPLQVLRDPVSLAADELSGCTGCDTGSCGLIETDDWFLWVVNQETREDRLAGGVLFGCDAKEDHPSGSVFLGGSYRMSDAELMRRRRARRTSTGPA